MNSRKITRGLQERAVFMSENNNTIRNRPERNRSPQDAGPLPCDVVSFVCEERDGTCDPDGCASRKTLQEKKAENHARTRETEQDRISSEEHPSEIGPEGEVSNTDPDSEGKESDTDACLVKELTVESVPEKINAVTAFINSELEAYDCSRRTRIQIDIAVDELFANIVHHAYASRGGDITVRVCISGKDRTARITLIDSGKPFDPLSAPEPDISLPVEQRAVGGLGIYLVKKTMDDLRYEYSDGKNFVTIAKAI